MSTPQTSECPVCGGKEIATGKKQKREDGKVYHEMQCTECKSIGWEWKTDWDVLLLSKRMVVPLFMLCGFAGGLSLLFASIFIPGFFGSGSWSKLFLFAVIGVGLIAFGLRPRVVRFFPADKIIKVGWGLRWTWVYKTIQPQEWVKLHVSKVLPVGVMPRGSTMRVYDLTPYWKLVGQRKNGAQIFLSQYPTEQEALKAKLFFGQQFGL